MKNKLGILLAATKNSSFTIGTLLINLMDLMSKKIDIFYILHDGFSLEDQKIMKNIVQNKQIKFILFTQENFTKAIENQCKQTEQKEDISNLFFIQRWTHMAFARFEAFKFLNECQCIIYIDFDVLLLKDISELFKLKEQNYHLGARLGKTLLKVALPSETNYPNKHTYQTGILVFTDNIKHPLKYYNFIYFYLSQNNDNLQDQGVFSLMVFKHHLKVKDLKDKYTGSTHYLTNTMQNASIVHASGTNSRFWNSLLCNKTWPQWQRYYEQWQQLGGSKYDGIFNADTKQSRYRIKYHLSYKLGYAFIEAMNNKKRLFILPYTLFQIYRQHKTLAKKFQRDLKTNPHLKLPPLKYYEDYSTEGLKNKQSYSYKIGKRLIYAQKNWYKGGYFIFIKQLKKIFKDYKNKQK
ncbi:glycosyltransferase [Campylobacter insulaenigrae]|uniref:glycosyltransferase n=1 Tax=Campylobacter insulaenigrae TaxID=260714 RepID=UPI0021529E63|nr:glycosyltransferase [Campylobacter insulaenigrae]MCR6576273.1 glycosyltransferase [Campylobacter insulaenigrae]